MGGLEGFNEEAFEVFGFGAGDEDGVVCGLLAVGVETDEAAGVCGGFDEGGPEGVAGDVLGAAVGGEDAAGAEEFEGADVEFAVAAEGAGDAGGVAGEGGGIEDDEVVGVFGGGGAGVFAEVVEHVGGFEAGGAGEAVFAGVFCGEGGAFLAAIEAEGVGGSGFGAVEGEAALIAEAVEHAAAFGVLCHEAVLGALVEVEACFVAAEEVELELDAAHV